MAAGFYTSLFLLSLDFKFGVHSDFISTGVLTLCVGVCVWGGVEVCVCHNYSASCIHIYSQLSKFL